MSAAAGNNGPPAGSDARDTPHPEPDQALQEDGSLTSEPAPADIVGAAPLTAAELQAFDAIIHREGNSGAVTAEPEMSPPTLTRIKIGFLQAIKRLRCAAATFWHRMGPVVMQWARGHRSELGRLAVRVFERLRLPGWLARLFRDARFVGLLST